MNLKASVVRALNRRPLPRWRLVLRKSGNEGDNLPAPGPFRRPAGGGGRFAPRSLAARALIAERLPAPDLAPATWQLRHNGISLVRLRG